MQGYLSRLKFPFALGHISVCTIKTEETEFDSR